MEPSTEDRRSDDQAEAEGEAFVAGALPESDRREPDAEVPIAEASAAPDIAPAVPAVNVEAIERGFDGVRVREVGERFTIPEGQELATWLKVVE